MKKSFIWFILLLGIVQSLFAQTEERNNPQFSPKFVCSINGQLGAGGGSWYQYNLYNDKFEENTDGNMYIGYSISASYFQYISHYRNYPRIDIELNVEQRSLFTKMMGDITTQYIRPKVWLWKTLAVYPIFHKSRMIPNKIANHLISFPNSRLLLSGMGWGTSIGMIKREEKVTILSSINAEYLHSKDSKNNELRNWIAYLRGGFSFDFCSQICWTIDMGACYFKPTYSAVSDPKYRNDFSELSLHLSAGLSLVF